jgi:thioesterase domain-containing protein/acyl carrier protein
MLLGKYLITSEATILQATPATWRMLQSDPQSVQGLKALCGGEALPGDLAETLLDQGYELWNVYGPTETTIWSTCCRVEHNPITIGRPIDNTRVYVLDGTMAPVPVGVPGELYIGGDGLARGYLNRPELTAEKFIADPFRGCPGARLHRTGDRVRYRPDGRLEYLERIDHQVKIRGFRIELGEIEAVLRALPEVAEVVVVAREDVPGDKRLVAYLVSQSRSVSPGDLRNHLRRNLPEYMVPSAFVFLVALPLTPNGKVDREALPVPEGSGYEEAYVVPRNPMEEGLAEIWREVLGLEHVGVHDSFFDLGGHSLLAVRLFARIEQRFGTRLPLSTLFHSPTITHLASLLHSEAPDSLWSSLVAIQPYGDKPPFFCVHAIGANLLNYRLLAHHLGADQPFYGFQAQGLDGEAKMHSSVEEMAAHYISEMRKVKPFGPYRLGGGSAGGVIAFEMARQLKLQGEEVDLLALIDTSCPSSQGRLPQSFRTRILTGLDLRWGSLLNHQGSLYAFLIEWIREYVHVLTHRTLAKPGRVGDEELAPNIRRVVQAGRQVLDAYNPSPYPGRITLFLVRIDPQRTAFDTRLQWGELVHGGMEVAFIDGDHTTMMEEPFVRNLATKLQACLNRTAGTVSPPFS